MHEGSPRWMRVAVFVVVAASALPGALAADDEPPYFAERFGGRIERIVVGPDGTIYVAGHTDVADLPASTSTPTPPAGGGYYDHRNLYFVAALERDGTPRWTSYAVGQAPDWVRSVRGLAVGPDGSVWLAAVGFVEPVPASQPAHHEYWSDVALAKFSADGALLFAGNLGGIGDDLVSDLAVRADGDAIVVGTTASDDFPGAPQTDPTPGSSYDAFVARMHGDGSGPVWAQRYGGGWRSRNYFGGGVALDAADGTILVGVIGGKSGTHVPFTSDLNAHGIRSPRVDPADVACAVIRLDGAGTQTEGARLEFLGAQGGRAGTDAPIALAPDGSVLVGGSLGVARVTPQLFLAVEDAWTHPMRYSVASRLCLDPNGGVVVAERFDDGYAGLRISVLGPDLAETAPYIDRTVELGIAASDIAVDADGSLLVCGTGAGAPFNAAYERAGPPTGCIARVPLEGVRAPARLRARVVGTQEVDLSWSRDGDPASGFDIEVADTDAAPRVIGHVAGDVRRFRATGLTPGGYHQLRVVAVFASGVRSATPVRQVNMPPETPDAVLVEDRPGQSVSVQLDDPNTSASRWRIQRRFGDGPWMETGLYGVYPAPSRTVGSWLEIPSALDVIPDVAGPVTYRVQTAFGRRRSPWKESAPFVPASTMRVTPTSGHLGLTTPKGREFLVVGTLSAKDGGPLSFDPVTEEFRLLYGSAAAPVTFAIRPGYPGWTSAEGIHTWNADEGLSGWENGSQIVLDLAHGTFLVRLISSPVWDVPTTQIALNLSFGAFSGGDVSTWRGRTGWAQTLRFGDDSSLGKRACAR